MQQLSISANALMLPQTIDILAVKCVSTLDLHAVARHLQNLRTMLWQKSFLIQRWMFLTFAKMLAAFTIGYSASAFGQTANLQLKSVY
jgi:hypothetical protein